MSIRTIGEPQDREDKPEERPSPNDFVNFFPWACLQFPSEYTVVVTRVVQSEYVSIAASDKQKKTRPIKQNASHCDNTSTEGKNKSSSGFDDSRDFIDHNLIKISACCDIYGNVVELKFLNNNYLPRIIFKILGLIIKFQNFLTRITINSGMDKHTIYEINKFLHDSYITEICLDDTFLPEANYDILLDAPNKIRYLSLARCNIDDTILKNISQKLAYPLPASHVLAILILSSNRITDKGVVYFAKALRSNRRLSYISLADNNLTDDGVNVILNSLTEFSLSDEEITSSKLRYMKYLKEKDNMVNNLIKELRSNEYDKKNATKKKFGRPVTSNAASVKKGKLEKESSLKSLVDSRSTPNLDHMFHDKAVSMVNEMLQNFSDPFSSDNTFIKNGRQYCNGNNTVSYLNLAYNNISYLSLKRLLNVLIYQKLLNRRPKGLINLCVEGNNLPTSCKELSQIDDILEMGLILSNHRSSVVLKKHRPVPRNTPH